MRHKNINNDIIETMGVRKVVKIKCSNGSLRGNPSRELHRQSQLKIEDNDNKLLLISQKKTRKSSSGSQKEKDIQNLGIIGQTAILSRNRIQSKLRASDKMPQEKLASTNQSFVNTLSNKQKRRNTNQSQNSNESKQKLSLDLQNNLQAVIFNSRQANKNRYETVNKLHKKNKTQMNATFNLLNERSQADSQKESQANRHSFRQERNSTQGLDHLSSKLVSNLNSTDRTTFGATPAPNPSKLQPQSPLHVQLNHVQNSKKKLIDSGPKLNPPLPALGSNQYPQGPPYQSSQETEEFFEEGEARDLGGMGEEGHGGSATVSCDNSLEEYDEGEMARIAADLQQFIIQESQTPYYFSNKSTFFDSKRCLNLKTMTRLKIQQALSRAKRNKTPAPITGQSLKQDIKQGKNSPNNSQLDQLIKLISKRRDKKKEKAICKDKSKKQTTKIIIFGVNNSQALPSDRHRSPDDRLSSGRNVLFAGSTRAKNSLESSRQMKKEGDKYHVKSLYEQSDKKSLYNESLIQSQTEAEKCVPNFTSRNQRNQPADSYDITSLCQTSRKFYNNSTSFEKKSAVKLLKQSTTNLALKAKKSSKNSKQKQHIVEIGSFSLIPDTKIFGDKINQAISSNAKKDYEDDLSSPDLISYHKHANQGDLASTQRSQNNSMCKSMQGGVPQANNYDAESLKVRQKTGSIPKNESAQMRNSSKKQLSLMHIVASSKPSSLAEKAPTRNDSMNTNGSMKNQSVALDVAQKQQQQSRNSSSRNQQQNLLNEIDGIVLSQVQDPVPSQDFPSNLIIPVSSQSPPLKNDQQLDQKVIDEKEEFVVSDQFIARGAAQPKEEDGLVQIMSNVARPDHKNTTVANSNEVHAGTKAVRLPALSYGPEKENIKEVQQVTGHQSNSHEAESVPSSHLMNTTLFQNQSHSKEKNCMAQTSYGPQVFKDNLAKASSLRVSELMFGGAFNPRIRSPVTEHAYIKVSSGALSHAAEDELNEYRGLQNRMVNTYGMMSGHLIGTTFSSPRGQDDKHNKTFMIPFQQSVHPAQKQRRLGSRPSLQNQVVFQVMGSNSQRKMNDNLRISENPEISTAKQPTDPVDSQTQHLAGHIILPTSTHQPSPTETHRESPGYSEISRTAQFREETDNAQRDKIVSFLPDEYGVPENIGLVGVKSTDLKTEGSGSHEAGPQHGDSQMMSDKIMIQNHNKKSASKNEFKLYSEEQSTDRSQGLEKQAQNFQIQEAIKQLQIILRQKQQQFKVKNTASKKNRRYNSRQSQYEMIQNSPQLMFPQLGGCDQKDSEVKTRLKDYFRQSSKDNLFRFGFRNSSVVLPGPKKADKKLFDLQNMEMSETNRNSLLLANKSTQMWKTSHYFDGSNKTLYQKFREQQCHSQLQSKNQVNRICNQSNHLAKISTANYKNRQNSN